MQIIEEIVRGPISSGSMRDIYDKLNGSDREVGYMDELYTEFPQYARGTVRWAVSKLVKGGYIHKFILNGYSYYGNEAAIKNLRERARIYA